MASLEELKKRLYKREENFEERTHSPDISQTDFKKKESERAREEHITKKIDLNKLMGSKYVWITAGAAVIVFLLLFFSSIFDFQNIDLKIEGLNEIKSGEKISWKVTATNRNKKDIKEAALIFSVPDIFRQRADIGTVKSGESITYEFESTVFGGRGKELEAKALLEYKPENSSSFFAEEQFFSFFIAQSPVTVSLVMPEEARVGGDVNFEIRYFSQSEEKLSNLFLKVDYPSDFEYKLSDITPTEENNIWLIGDLKPGEEGSIEVQGKIKDTSADILSFKAFIGSRSGDDFLSLDEVLHTLVLRMLHLSVDILPAGNKDYSASVGEEIPFLVNWKNNLPEVIEDSSLEIILVGENFDFSSVRVREGSFISRERKIVWNPSSYKDFSNISPGKSGFVGFSLRVKKDISLNNTVKNPVLILKALLKPGKSIQGFENTNIFGEDEIEIRISTSLQFSAKGLYFDVIPQNSGPLPPKAGEETTYTITWSVANPLNDIKNLVVKSNLPPYVNFKEIFFPASANIVFDKNTGVVEWRVGTLPAGTGFVSPAVSLSFQVGLVPSVTHIGSSPAIIVEAKATGLDSFTEKSLVARENEITTDLKDDPRIDFSMKNVVE